MMMSYLLVYSPILGLDTPFVDIARDLCCLDKQASKPPQIPFQEEVGAPG